MREEPAALSPEEIHAILERGSEIFIHDEELPELDAVDDMTAIFQSGITLATTPFPIEALRRLRDLAEGSRTINYVHLAGALGGFHFTERRGLPIMHALTVSQIVWPVELTDALVDGRALDAYDWACLAGVVALVRAGHELSEIGQGRFFQWVKATLSSHDWALQRVAVDIAHGLISAGGESREGMVHFDLPLEAVEAVLHTKSPNETIELLLDIVAHGVVGGVDEVKKLFIDPRVGEPLTHLLNYYVFPIPQVRQAAAKLFFNVVLSLSTAPPNYQPPPIFLSELQKRIADCCANDAECPPSATTVFYLETILVMASMPALDGILSYPVCRALADRYASYDGPVPDLGSVSALLMARIAAHVPASRAQSAAASAGAATSASASAAAPGAPTKAPSGSYEY